MAEGGIISKLVSQMETGRWNWGAWYQQTEEEPVLFSSCITDLRLANLGRELQFPDLDDEFRGGKA